MKRNLLLAVAMFLSFGMFAQIQINEIRMDNTGDDTDEYFELKGTPGTSLNNHYLIILGDAPDGGSGSIESVTNLTGQSIPADGHFLCYKQTAGTMFQDVVIDYVDAAMNMENSDNETYLLVTGFSGANGDDLDTDDNGTLNSTPWTAIVDQISLVETTNVPAAGEYYYSTTTLGPDGSGFVPGHSFRNSSTGAWTIGVFGPAGVMDTPGTINASSSVASIFATFSVYPNPVSSSLTISSEEMISTVDVINVIGQTVISQNVNSKLTQIATSNLKNGVYFVRVQDNNGNTSVSKILKN